MKFSIESHFVGVHGPYELHRKEKQIECTAHFVGVHEPYELHRKEKQIFMHRLRGAWKFAFLSDAIHIVREHRQKCNSILIFTSFYNKVCRGIAYFNTKMSYLSDFKSTKSKTLRTASTGRMTNWKKPPHYPVQIIRTKDWYFKSLIFVNSATSYFFTNLRH